MEKIYAEERFMEFRAALEQYNNELVAFETTNSFPPELPEQPRLWVESTSSMRSAFEHALEVYNQCHIAIQKNRRARALLERAHNTPLNLRGRALLERAHNTPLNTHGRALLARAHNTPLPRR